ncbi:hypothetical protein AKG09_00990 [Neisseria sp. 83E34]|nr:hypothetical protein AKG09_00990 [Neisseria sp. 83E34]
MILIYLNACLKIYFQKHKKKLPKGSSTSIDKGNIFLTLTRFKTRIAFANHINFSATAHHLAISVALFGGF